MSSCRVQTQVVTVANSLFHSLQGQYFVGNTENLFFDKGKYAWAALVNPRNSGVNLFVNVWTVTNLHEPPILAQIFLNSMLHGDLTRSNLVTPTNTAICPLPRPRIRLLQAANINEVPSGGVEAFTRMIPTSTTVAEEEDGKFIIPPGGNFAAFLSNPAETDIRTSVKVAFGWWESTACIY